MANVTISNLRNHPGNVIDRVAAGEHLIVTRYGKPVAELRPLPVRALTAAALLERWQYLPPLDPVAFRRDVDAVLDPRM